jgi:hypothetical protein
MMDTLEKAIKIEKPKKSPTEKAELQRRKFCDVTRKMLEEVNNKNRMIDNLVSQEQERQILTGVAGLSDYAKHRDVLEKLRLSILQTKSAFNCGD